jgi:hypothetical protein
MLIYGGPTIRAHGEYLGNLEQRARAQRTLAGKYSLERAQVGAARVLELVPSRINWFESKYGEWLATGAEAVCGYSDGSLPQLGLPGPLSKLYGYEIKQYADICRA